MRLGISIHASDHTSLAYRYYSPLHQVTLIAINTALPEAQQAQLTAAVIELVASQQSLLASTPQQSEGCLCVLASTLLQRSKLKGAI